MDSSQELLGPILENRFGERYFSSIVGEAFSPTGSDSFYQRHYGVSLVENDRLYIIVGTDGGLLLNWLLTQKPAADSRYLFVEVAACLERLNREGIIPQDLPDNVHLQPYETWLEKASELSMKDYFYVSRISPILSLSVIDGYHDAYVELGNKFSEDIGHFQIEMLMEVGSQIFTVKGLENLADNQIPISTLDDSFRGKTAILMAGGPSLDESFAWIRANRQNLVVLAVSRVALQLKRENITPDFLFAIDPHDLIFHQSKEMLHFFQRTFMVNMYHLNPQLVGQWRGKSLYLGALFPWGTENNPANVLFPGITVSHQALGAAIKLGFSQIILSGFDLCFSKEGFTHAKGSEETLAGPYAKRSKLWIETNGGWQAETSPDFHSSIPALSHLAGQGWESKDQRCHVVNPSTASAKIENIDHQPWDSLSVQPLDVPAWDKSNQILDEAGLASRAEHYRMVEKELNTFRGQLLKVKKLSEEAMVCNDKLFGRKGHPPDFKYKKQMDKIEISMNEDFAEASRLVKKWSVGELLKLSKPDKEREWSDAEVEETGRRYYEIHLESCRDFIKVLDESRQRVRSRLEEEKPQPNMKTLMLQWKKDKQPGRLLRFLDQSGRALEDFPEKQANSLNALLQDFQELMDENDTDYKAHCQNILASPMAILGKAKNFFSNGEIDRLENFLDGIRGSNLAQKDDFVLLMEGYLAHKAGQFDRALDCYEKIEFELLQSECLKQGLSVYLKKNDLKGALLVAKQLSESTPVFTPYYADLLRLTGDGEQAIVMYKQYLDLVLNDFITQQKLGKLYGDMGNITAACELFNTILEQDPGNKAARHYLEQYAS
jgi:tetratricopeptide (TPR) repeat protein